MTLPTVHRGEKKTGRAFQDAFFRRMGTSQQFRLLFDALPAVHFFAKDAQGRFVAASPEVVRRLGMSSEEELIGRTDRDFYPPQLCATIEADDARVMATGEPMLNQLETWFDNSRVLDWFVTSKFPMHDEEGHVIGVMGFVRPYEGKDGRKQVWAAGTGFSRAVDYIRDHIGQAMSVKDLAFKAGLSERQLHRKFVEAFGMAPKAFIMRTRIQAACELLLKGDKSVAEIAIECGFCDQSSFTRNFRQELGSTPSTFQKTHLSAVHVR